MKSVMQSRLLQTLASRARIAPVVVAVALAGFFAASCDVHGISSPGTLASLTVSPDPSTLAINGTQTFIAVGRDAAGVVVPVTPLWTLASGGGAISATGTFTAGTTPGQFANTVVATAGGLSDNATVTVIAGPLASITVTPNPETLPAGSAQQFTAVGRDAGGNPVPFTPVWSVTNSGGSIDAGTGLFTAGGTSGTFANTVRATSGTIFGTATVTVTPVLATITVTPDPATVPVGATQQFAATGRDASNNIVAITPVWSVVNGGGTIDPSTGLFTAGATPGTFANTVRATSGTIFGSATVTVTAPPPVLATITVTPNPASMPTNATQQFSATGQDGSGNPFAISPVWSVVNGGGTIDPSSGLFTAGVVTGTFTNTVRATSGTVSGFATVTVTSPPPPPPPPPAPIVNLGTGAPNGVMAGTAFTCVTGGFIFADIAISPGSTVTGFPPCVITGTQHLNDAVAIQAQIDLTNAYNTLAGLPCGTAIVADLGGTTVPAGVYCSASTIGVTGTLTLDGGGDPNATFVFQAGSGLTTAGSIVLINGAQAKNVYWQVGSSATIGTASQWQGNILALTSITLVDNANLLGRALARNGAVSLGTNNTITLP